MVAQFASFALAVQAVRKGTRDFLAFSQATSEINTILDTSQISLGEVEQQVLDLSLALGEQETLIAKGFYQTLSAGVTDAGEAMFLLEEASKLAIAGLSTTEASVDVLTSIIAAYGQEVGEATDITDQLFKTVELGKTRIPELASNLGAILPVASELGVNLEQVLAAIAALTKQGASTSEAVTRISSIFTVLQKKAGEVDAAFQGIGKSFDRDTLASQGLQQTLLDLREAFEGNENALVELIGRKEGITGLFALTRDGASVLEQTLKELEDRTGAAGDAFDKQMLSPAKEFQVLVGGVRQGFLELGEALVTTFTDGAKEMGTIQEAAEVLRDTIASFTFPLKAFLGVLGSAAAQMTALAAAAASVQNFLTGDGSQAAKDRVRELTEASIIAFEISRNLITGDDDFTASAIINQKRRRRLIVEERNELRELAEALEVMVTQRILKDLPKGEGIDGLQETFDKLKTGVEQADISLARLLNGNTERAKLLRDTLRSLGVEVDEIHELPPLLITPPKEDDDAPDPDETLSFLDSFEQRLGKIKESLGNQELGRLAADGLFFALDRGFDKLANDLVEGEANFSDFADQVVKDLGKIIIKLLLLRAVRAVLPGLAEGGVTPAVEDILAKGGVRGPMVGHLPIKNYASGGIANTPQLAIFGEGTSPGGEAFVPLGGDRKIPVKFPDGGGGGSGPVSVSLTVNALDPRTSADTILAQETVISDMIANAIASGRSRKLVTAVRGAGGRR
jgi:TP901 family phage tail tape measure protein